MKEVLLYHLFAAIRAEKRLAVSGTGDYLLLQQFMEEGDCIYPMETFENFAFVCEKLWLKNKEEEQLFRDILKKWQQEIEKYILTQYKMIDQLKDQQKQPTGPAEPPLTEDPSRVHPTDPAPPAPAPAEPQAKAPGPETPISDTRTAVPQAEEDDAEGELSFSIGSEDGSANTITRRAAPDYQPAADAFSKTFLFGDEYFPVANRYLRQNWRNLKSSQEIDECNNIDFIKTTNSIARTGFFTAFDYEKNIDNLVSLFIFIDQGGSMEPCEAFGNELANSAHQSALHTSTVPYYFYNLPEQRFLGAQADYTFFNQEKTVAYTACSLFCNLNKKNIVALIYSDAGALRGTTDETTPARVQETTEFLRFLLKRTANIAWINPAPKERWKNTAAQNISQAFAEVPMFEATPTGITQAVNALKGKMSVYH